jgi:hypothetical protein
MMELAAVRDIGAGSYCTKIEERSMDCTDWRSIQ